MDIRVAGENALIVYLGEAVCQQTLARVRQFVQALELACPEVIIDLIPSYHSVVVVYDSRLTSFATLKKAILALKLTQNEAATDSGKLIRLPVYYSQESGADLQRLESLHNLTAEEIIDLHSSMEYLVYAIGFAPGFAYLGEVDSRIATPRHTTPRLQVPKGAVAIADNQTAVYPDASPGGWNLIGLCPTPMFDPANEAVMPCDVGDIVRFYPITRDEYLKLGGQL